MAGNASAIVIRSNEISGSALQAIRTRIPSVRISTDGPCPRITFRGNLSLNNPRDPTVYIDGTLVADTCALTMVTGADVDRIEVYPSGDTPDATLQRNPAGVIIVYRRRE